MKYNDTSKLMKIKYNETIKKLLLIAGVFSLGVAFGLVLACIVILWL
ncbi:unnamed protein product [marine sediment metagenome]|uniref:Uncharacterized protein n=1 Tax=marine sediment metagenome TaxID=412755 RepID=X0Z852_9ZZZZ